MKNQKKIGIILSYIIQVIKILSSLLYTPFMLRRLGQSDFGLFQLVTSIVAYLSMLNLGLSSSYTKFYFQEKKKGGDDAVASLNALYFTILIVMAFVCSICGLVILKNFRFVVGNELLDSEYTKAYILFVMMVVNMALSFPASLFSLYIYANEQYIYQKLMGVVQSILSPFISIPLLLMGHGSVGIVAVNIFLFLVFTVADIIYARRKLKFSMTFEHLDFSLFKDLWAFTVWIFISQLVDLLNWNIDKYILGRLKGTEAVAIYGIGGQISTMYNAFSTAISGVFVAQINNIVSNKGKTIELSKIFIKVGRMQFIVLWLLLSGFFLFGKSFISLWAGQGYQESYYVTLLLIGPVTIPWIQTIGLEIQRAKNKHKARSIVYFIFAIINAIISIPLSMKWGPIGAAFGTGVTLVLCNGLFMNWYYKKRLLLDIDDFWRKIASFIPAIILPLGVAITVKYMFDNGEPMNFIICCIVYLVCYSLSIWRFGLSDSEKDKVCEIIKVKN